MPMTWKNLAGNYTSDTPHVRVLVSAEDTALLLRT